MEPRKRSAIVQAVIAGIAIIATTWGTRYNWPDFVHVKHGLPLTWTVHTLSTIAGPVDTWEVNMAALVLDLALWAALTLLIPLYINREK